MQHDKSNNFSLHPIAAAIASTPLQAKEIRLPNIVVVGETAEDITSQPGSVTLITEEELELIQPLSTEDALRRVPGIAVKGEEETAVVVNFEVRGLPADSSKTLVLEDGVPVQPSLFLGNARYFLDCRHK